MGYAPMLRLAETVGVHLKNEETHNHIINNHYRVNSLMVLRHLARVRRDN